MFKIIGIYLMMIQIVYGYINIYPSFFYKELKKEGTYETFTLTNRSSEKIRYRIYFEDNFLQELKIEVYPKSITLNPYEKKEFKVLVTPTENLKIGMHECVLVVKEIGIPNGKRKKVYSELKLKLSGYYGDLKLKLDGKVKKNKDKLDVLVENKGKRTGVFSAYLLDEEKQWVFLDSFILKSQEKWKEEYSLEKRYTHIKIEEQDGKEYFLQVLK